MQPADETWAPAAGSSQPGNQGFGSVDGQGQPAVQIWAPIMGGAQPAHQNWDPTMGLSELAAQSWGPAMSGSQPALQSLGPAMGTAQPGGQSFVPVGGEGQAADQSWVPSTDATQPPDQSWVGMGGSNLASQNWASTMNAGQPAAQIQSYMPAMASPQPVAQSLATVAGSHPAATAASAAAAWNKVWASTAGVAQAPGQTLLDGSSQRSDWVPTADPGAGGKIAGPQPAAAGIMNQFKEQNGHGAPQTFGHDSDWLSAVSKIIGDSDSKTGAVVSAALGHTKDWMTQLGDSIHNDEDVQRKLIKSLGNPGNLYSNLANGTYGSASPVALVSSASPSASPLSDLPAGEV